jgi:hypothetical protein
LYFSLIWVFMDASPTMGRSCRCLCAFFHCATPIGTSRGIGFELALQFAKTGHQVAISQKHSTKLY